MSNFIVTGKFIGKAYITIKNWEILDLVESLKKLGYTTECEKDGYAHKLYIANGEYRYHLPFFHIDRDSYINCNEYANGDEEKAIELFMIIANLTNQIIGSWTTFNDRQIVSQVLFDEETIRKNNYYIDTYGESGRATQLEIAEAFQRGEI